MSVELQDHIARQIGSEVKRVKEKDTPLYREFSLITTEKDGLLLDFITQRLEQLSKINYRFSFRSYLKGVGIGHYATRLEQPGEQLVPLAVADLQSYEERITQLSANLTTQYVENQWRDLLIKEIETVNKPLIAFIQDTMGKDTPLDFIWGIADGLLPYKLRNLH